MVERARRCSPKPERERVSRRAGILFPFLAVLVTVLFYASLQGWRFTRIGAVSAGAASFHGGKGSVSLKRDPACSAQECHTPSPHRKPVPWSAFLNMHETVVSCLGCHGRDPERRWGAGKRQGKALSGSPTRRFPRWAGGGDTTQTVLRRRAGVATRGGPEGDRRGRREGLHEAFEPIVLRMIEGGGRKWLPDDMR